MAHRTWVIDIEGNQHTVELAQGWWSGSRRIWVDGELIEKSRKLIDSGSIHLFTIDGHPCELLITTNGLTFGFHLLVDDVPMQSTRELETGKPAKLPRALLEEVAYWRALAEETGLQYVADPGGHLSWRHRLVGRLHGHLTVVRLGMMQNTGQTVMSVLVRCSLSTDLKTTRSDIERDLLGQSLLSKRHAKQGYFALYEAGAVLVLRYRPRKESADQATTRMKSFVNAVATYTQPAPSECEGRACKHNPDQPPRLVFVNDFPFALCSACVDEWLRLGQEAERTYKAKPGHLLRGTLAGLAAALFGGLAGGVLAGLVWSVSIWVITWTKTASVPGFFEELAKAVLAIAMPVLILLAFLKLPVGVIQLMDRLGTKRTAASALTTLGISMVGTICGAFGFALWDAARRLASRAPGAIVSDAWQLLFDNTVPVLILTGFASASAAWNVFTSLGATKRYLAQTFQPAVETLEGLM